MIGLAIDAFAIFNGWLAIGAINHKRPFLAAWFGVPALVAAIALGVAVGMVLAAQ